MKVDVNHPNSFRLQPVPEETGKELLDTAKQVCKTLGFKWWVSCGTALGLYRDGRTIPHDTDVDIGILAHWNDQLVHTVNVTALQNEMTSRGFKLAREVFADQRPMQLCFAHDVHGHLLDFMFYYEGKEDNKLVHFNADVKVEKPAELFGKLQTFDVQGYGKYPFPSPVEKYLHVRYGREWKIPENKKNNWRLQINKEHVKLG